MPSAYTHRTGLEEIRETIGVVGVAEILVVVPVVRAEGAIGIVGQKGNRVVRILKVLGGQRIKQTITLSTLIPLAPKNLGFVARLAGVMRFHRSC